MNNEYDTLVKKAIELGADDARLIDAGQVVFDPRTQLKCRFGCLRWGRYWTCPPHLGLSQETFDRAFKKYSKALIIKTADPEQGQDLAVALEKEAMLKRGAVFALALALCVKCEECAWPEPCRHPELARPSMDALGMDIGRTLEPLGFEVKFDAAGKLLPAWYTMVLLD